eukprot:gene17137-22651_t
MKSVYELLENKQIQNTLTICDPIIDKVVGGIKSKLVYEVSGEAGTGKTQLCLSLSVRQILQTLNESKIRTVAYISCGEVLSHIYIENCYNSDNFLENLTSSLPELVQRRNVGLVIVDSIAGIVRSEYDTSNKENMIHRSNILFRISKQLKWLADTFNLAIVVVNQVSQSISKQNQSRIKPSLGLAWSHCINARIMLSRNDVISRMEYTDESSDNTTTRCKFVRYLSLEFSPYRPSSGCYFEISSSDLIGIISKQYSHFS